MPVWSHSRLSSFEKCPLQYRYRYVERIRRDVFGIEAFLGNRVHEALEHLYGEVRQRRVPRLADLLALYHRNWEAEYADRVRIVRAGLTAADYRQAGEDYLRTFYAEAHPFDDGETVGLEEKVEFALDPAGRYAMVGYIDRLVRAAPGVYEIHDYKTTAFLPRDEDLRRDRQLTLYQLAVQGGRADAREIRLVWHFLAHGVTRVLQRSPEEVEAHRRQTVRLIDAIEAARDHPARPSKLCLWCEYRDICPAQKDEVARERVAEERARQDLQARYLAGVGRPITRAEQGSLFGGAPASAPSVPRPAPGRPRHPPE